MPLYNWIEIATGGGFRHLVRTGVCGDDELLKEHYSKLLEEYQRLVKDARTGQELKLKIIVTQLANKIDQVNIAIHALRTGGRDEGIIRVLRTPYPNGLGFGRLSYVNLEHDLKLTESYLQMDVVRFKQRQIEMEEFFKKAASKSEGGGGGKSDFYSEIASLSKWLGFNISPRETSLMEYVSYLNLLKLEIKNNANK